MRSSLLKSILTITFLSVVILFVSCDDPKPIAPEETLTGEMQGTLLNEFNEPVANAVVQIVETTTGKVSAQEEKVIESDTTDEDGNYHFKKIPSDLTLIDLVILHPDLETFRINLSDVLKGKDIKRVIIKVQYKQDCCGKIFIKVLNAKDSSVIEKVGLRLYEEKEIKRKAYTNERGLYTFMEVCEGEYWLRLEKEGYKVAEIDDIKVKGCDESDYVELTVFMEEKEAKDTLDCNAQLKVYAKDTESGEALKEFTVKLMKDGKIVAKKYGKEGYVTFEELCEGEYKVIVYADGYITEDAAVNIDKNEEKEITLELQKNDCCDGIMTFYVTDEDGNPLEKAEVRLWLDGKKKRVGVTNSDGVVEFKELCKGVYGIDIQKNGYESIEFKEELPCNETVRITKTLKAKEKCTSKVKINVKDEKGNTIAGANVYLYTNNTKVGLKTTDKSGDVIFEELCGGKYIALIKKEGYKEQKFDFYLEDNATKEFYQKMEAADSTDCEGKVEVYVTDEQGNPLQYVMAALWQGSKKIGLTKTNADGKAVFEGICEGEYQITLTLKGYKGLEFDFYLNKDENKGFRKQLQKDNSDSCCNGQIKVYIDDENDDALSYVVGKLYLNGRKVGLAKSNDDGYMLFSKVCEGTYTLLLSKDGYKEIEMKVEVGCDETVEINKTMEKLDSCCTAILKLIVLDENKQAIADADIEIYQNGETIKEGKTNKDGYWYVTDLCAPATYVVEIKKDGYESQEFEITYEWCNKITKKIILKK